ncbi:SRPBCC family protein [Pseudopedobacter sp.]|uniref:SRPBCC family protein n=1 Tax=Pseudopedobacter sp. TaxID=1936787 RepID=UPI00334001D0
MTSIKISTTINAPIEKVWKFWTDPEHIKQWNNPSPDWHTPHAENDLRKNGTFNFRMEAKDKSFGFDFSGIYSKVINFKEIAYTLGDQSKVEIIFLDKKGKTEINETFDAESENAVEMQRQGWQAILDNFRQYVEQH